METAHKISAVIFDKTGTLTYGKPVVTEYATFAKFPDKNRVLQLVASAEASSEHPLASAVVNFCTVSQNVKILHQPQEFAVTFDFIVVFLLWSIAFVIFFSFHPLFLIYLI